MRRALAAAATALLLTLNAEASAPAAMVPDTVRIDLPETRTVLVMSDPAFKGPSVEETPYQWLRVCAPDGSACRTVLDLRGSGGLSISADPALGLSPDHRYAIVLQMRGIDEKAKAVSGHYLELYDLVEAREAGFVTAEGKMASSDNILGWAPDQGHALKISTGRRKSAFAFPPAREGDAR